MRVAAIEVSHWHSLWDAAYLRILAAMPDVQLVGLHDPDAAVVARRAAEVGKPPVFTDYREMLARTKPDFVVALGQHNRMAATAHHLLDQGVAFMMEKPMGVSAAEVAGIAEKAAARNAFVAVPLPQRNSPFTVRARTMLAEGRFGPLSHLYFRLNRPTSARYPTWDAPWMLDPALAGGGCLRNLGSHVLDLFLQLTGEDAQVTAAQLSARALGQRVEDYASVQLRTPAGCWGPSRWATPCRTTAATASSRSPGGTRILILHHDDTLRVITRRAKRSPRCRRRRPSTRPSCTTSSTTSAAV